jgi:hypothetical protein
MLFTQFLVSSIEPIDIVAIAIISFLLLALRDVLLLTP